LTFFQENLRIFEKEEIVKNSKSEYPVLRVLRVNKAKQVHANFRLASLKPDRLKHIFDFTRKRLNFSGKLLSEF
jgi:hypothetical protein